MSHGKLDDHRWIKSKCDICKGTVVVCDDLECIYNFKGHQRLDKQTQKEAVVSEIFRQLEPFNVTQFTMDGITYYRK